MNFPEVESCAGAEFLVPDLGIITRKEYMENGRVFLQLRAAEIDEADMERLRHERLNLMQAEVEY
jgi:hypothetical protein